MVTLEGLKQSNIFLYDKYLLNYYSKPSTFLDTGKSMVNRLARAHELKQPKI